MDPNIETREQQEQVKPGPETIPYAEIADRLELSLLRPEWTEEQVAAACHKARSYQVGSVVVRPSDVDVAVRILDGTGVRVASIAGFPHGTSNTATKLYEGRDLLRRGAKEVALVINPSKMLSRQFQHVETEMLQMSESCHQNDAKFKVVFETGFLAEDLKIILCKMCKRVEADFAETGTGWGPPTANLAADIALMKQICKDVVKLKVGATPQATLADLLQWVDQGVERLGSANIFPILDEKKKIDAEVAAAKAAAEAAAKQQQQPLPEKPIS